MNNPGLKREFVALVEKHQGIIHKVSQMYCDNSECRQDLFQDILVQLWKSYPSFSHQSRFSTWMYRVALNTAIVQFKKDKKKIEQATADMPVHITQEETYSEAEERRNLVQQAIGKLNKAEKAIIILYMDDYTYEEIAEIAGITVSNAGVKINRIKSKLQTILKELDYGL
ncbi:MAG: sigma-70 family RNA polymerase sigma factor [Bacteroidales bacterium]|nr:sigma-70 family RNA polymerase sigma factor [Bacteroidales bacterium]